MNPRSKHQAAIVIASLLATLAAILWMLRVAELEVPPTHVETLGESPSPRAADPTRATLLEDAAQRTDRNDPPSETSALAPVSGTVRNASGALLAGVIIRAAGTFETSTTTDASGSFALSLPFEIATELSVTASGYRPHRELLRAPASCDIVLDRSPSLRGLVVQTNGAPVANAFVRWSNPMLARGSGATTTTAADGRFAFSELPRRIDLEVLADSTVPIYRSVHVDWDMDEVVLIAEPGRSAHGMVVHGETGEGIPGASVSLWFYATTFTTAGRRGGSAQHAQTVVTGPDGHFTLTRMPNPTKEHRVDAWTWTTAPGYAPHWKLVATPRLGDRLDVTLFAAGSVRGRVVDATGTPRPGTLVRAESQIQPLCDAGSNDNFRRQDAGHSTMWQSGRPEPVAPFHSEREALTDANGEYVIDEIPCASTGTDVALTVRFGFPRSTVVTGPGMVAEADDIVLDDSALRRFCGVVLDATRRPVAGAMVETAGVEMVVDAAGRFDCRVPAISGSRRIRVSAAGYQSQAIDRSDGATEDIVIVLVEGSELALRVVDRNGLPVPDIAIRAFAAGDVAETAQEHPRATPLCRANTDDLGAALLRGLPDACDLLLETANRERQKVVSGVATGVGMLEVVLDDVDTTLGRADVTFRIVDARTGTPHPGPVHVEAKSPSHTRRRSAPGPEIILRDLAHGRWDVVVAADGFGAATATLELRGDRVLELELGRGNSITGTVAASGGSLSRPVQVRALATASRRAAVARTDSAGRFEFAGVEPGEYVLSVEPFENPDFAFVPMRIAQDYASLAPVTVQVTSSAPPAPVQLTVVDVATLEVVVPASSASLDEQNFWTWAQDLRFAVQDERDRSVYSGGASEVTASAAHLTLSLPDGSYTARIEWRDRLLDARTLRPGESWRVEPR